MRGARFNDMNIKSPPPPAAAAGNWVVLESSSSSMLVCQNTASIWLREVSRALTITARASPTWTWKQTSWGLKSAAADCLCGIPLSRDTKAVLSRKAEYSRAPFRWASSIESRTKNPLPQLEGREEDDDGDWESEMFEGFGRAGSKAGRPLEDEDGQAAKWAREEETLVDWSAQARERAVKAVEERGLPVAALVEDGKKKRKRKKKKKKKMPAAPRVRLTKGKLESLETAARALDEEKASADGIVQDLMDNPLMARLGSGEGFQGLAALGDSLKNAGNAEEMRPADGARQDNVEIGFQTLSDRIGTPTPKSISGADDVKRPRGYSTVSRLNRQEDFDLNRMMVGAADATEVLSIIGDVIGDRVLGQDESPLSPFNVSTALHRVAKHLEVASMHRSDRLSFARKKIMARLVSIAIESLPQCSAQSISNIAWALSKVGGYYLYGMEMDLLADVAVGKISDLEPQHVANIAGALASMQHSVPPLFEALDQRASFQHRSFQSQELAQLLWAFATLNHPANLLLDSLDSDCGTFSQGIEERVRNEDFGTSYVDGDDKLPAYLADSFLRDEELESQEDGDKILQGNSNFSSATELEVVTQMTTKQGLRSTSLENYFENFSLSELASLSWSYTVLGQLNRPSFALIWHAVLNQGQGATSRVNDLPCPSLQLSQLYQTNLSLQLEFPELGLSLGQAFEILARTEWEKNKNGKMSTSVTQLDVGRLLVGMGRKWVAEYTAADYSLDAALVEERIGLEIDGPSHFARNTGAPLGHTLLKRRQLSAAGWTVLSIPYEEWDDQLGEEEQRCYLYNLLKSHL